MDVVKINLLNICNQSRDCETFEHQLIDWFIDHFTKVDNNSLVVEDSTINIQDVCQKLEKNPCFNSTWDFELTWTDLGILMTTRFVLRFEKGVMFHLSHYARRIINPLLSKKYRTTLMMAAHLPKHQDLPLKRSYFSSRIFEPHTLNLIMEFAVTSCEKQKKECELDQDTREEYRCMYHCCTKT